MIKWFSRTNPKNSVLSHFVICEISIVCKYVIICPGCFFPLRHLQNSVNHHFFYLQEIWVITFCVVLLNNLENWLKFNHWHTKRKLLLRYQSDFHPSKNTLTLDVDSLAEIPGPKAVLQQLLYWSRPRSVICHGLF